MFRKFVSLFLSVACIVTLVGTSFMKPYQAYAQEDFSEEIQAVLDLVNEQRAAVGVNPLTLNESLTEAAMIRAEEIVESFSHTRPDGSHFSTIIDELGLSYLFLGENIAAAYSDADEVMDGWVNSEMHYENIISKYYNEIGIGIVYDADSPYGYYWVQIFADYAEPIYTTPAVTTSVTEVSEVEMSTSAVTSVSRTQTNVSGETKKTEVSVATSVSYTETETTNVTKTSNVETLPVYVTETTSCSSTTTTTSATTATTTTRMFTDLYTVYTSFALNLHYMYSYCDYDDTTFTFVTPSDAVRVTRIPVYGLYTCNENGECTLISTTEGEHEVSYYSFNSCCYVTDCEYDSPSDMYDKLFRGKESDYYDGYAYTTMAVTISAPGLSNSNYYAEVRMSLPNVEQTTTTSATTTTTTTYASTALVTKPSLTTAVTAVTSETLPTATTRKVTVTTATTTTAASTALVTKPSLTIATSAVTSTTINTSATTTTTRHLLCVATGLFMKDYTEISEVKLVAENQNYTYKDTEYNLDGIYIEIEYQEIHEYYDEYSYSDGTRVIDEHKHITNTYTEKEYADSSWKFEYTPAEYYEKYADYDEDLEIDAYFERSNSEYDEYIDRYIPIKISGPEATTAVSTTDVSTTTTTVTTTEKYIVSSYAYTDTCRIEINSVNVVAENQNYTYQDTKYNLDDIYLEVGYEVIDNSYEVYFYSDGTSYRSNHPSYYESKIIEADSSWEFEYTPAEYYEKYADYDEDIEVEAYFECYLSEYGEYIDEYIPITISGPEATTAVSTTDVSTTTTTVTTTENPIVSSTVITSLCEISIYDINAVAENQNYTYQDTEYNLDDVYLEIKYKVIYNTTVIYYYSDGTSYTSHTPSTSSYYESEIIEADSSWEFEYTPAEYYEIYANYGEDIEVDAYFEYDIYLYSSYSAGARSSFPITISGPEATTAVSTTDVSTTTTTVTSTKASETTSSDTTTKTTTASASETTARTTSSKTTSTTAAKTTQTTTTEKTTETTAASQTASTTVSTTTSTTTTETENIFATVEDNGTIVIISCDTIIVNVIVPSEINGTIVSKINDYAFSNEEIETVKFNNPDVKIADSATTINENAVIYGYWDSTAHDYAVKYDREFVSINGEPAVEIVVGDANNDNKLTVSDAAFIARTLAKRETIDVKTNPAADFNGDGKVTVSDAAAIARELAKLKTK